MTELKPDEIIALIDKEIAWVKESSVTDPSFLEGFLGGLMQVKIIILETLRRLAEETK